MRLIASIVETDWWGVPAWTVMWLLAFTVFALCKVLTWRAEHRFLSTRATAAYLFGWPGMNPSVFIKRHPPATSGPWGCWMWALTKTVFGVAMIAIAIKLLSTDRPLITGWTGMIGVVFLLHFGIFDLLACFWRSVGYEVQPLMEAPHRSTSLMEFWSRRWNRAFRDLSNRLVLKPLLPRLGPTGAMVMVFLASGLIHDLVISVPSRGGYGLPTVYFLLQAIGVLLQREPWAKRWGLNTGIGGWVVTAFWLLAPLPLLFHQPFVVRVILPFLDAIPLTVTT